MAERDRPQMTKHHGACPLHAGQISFFLNLTNFTYSL